MKKASLGPYSTKEKSNPPAASEGYLFVSRAKGKKVNPKTPVEEYDTRPKLDDRHKGVQMFPKKQKPKMTGMTYSYALEKTKKGKTEIIAEEYVDNLTKIKDAMGVSHAGVKQGFLSSDSDGRGEFALHIRCEQYRQAIQKERVARELSEKKLGGEAEPEEHKAPQETSESDSQDQARKEVDFQRKVTAVLTELDPPQPCMKCQRDTIWCKHQHNRGGATNAPNNATSPNAATPDPAKKEVDATFETSGSAYGRGCVAVEKPKFGIRSLHQTSTHIEAVL